jgi:hypothetical protein
MTQKVHGFAKAPDQFLSGGLPMFTVTVANVDLTATTGTEEAHSVALDKLIELISVRAQPVVIGKVSATGFRFAVEHNDIFGTDAAGDNETLSGFAAKVQAGLRAALNDNTVTVAIAAFEF